MDDCIFCKIIAKSAPAEFVGENEKAIAFKSIQPVAQHHILIVPKKHLATFMDITGEDKDLYFAMISLAQQIIKEKDIIGGYKLVINGGKYQFVPHLHWHLLAGKLEEEDNILNRT